MARPNLGYFVKRPEELLGSPAFKALGRNGSRLLDCLEHLFTKAKRVGGALSMPYDLLEEWGIPRGAIALTLVRTEALGFINIVRRGRRSSDGKCYANLYSLTYAGAHEDPTPSHRWKLVRSLAHARSLIDTVTERYHAQRLAKRARAKIALHGSPVRNRTPSALPKSHSMSGAEIALSSSSRGGTAHLGSAPLPRPQLPRPISPLARALSASTSSIAGLAAALGLTAASPQGAAFTAGSLPGAANPQGLRLV